MIDYGIFNFSAAPGTGVDWFMKATQQAGLGPGFRHRATVPFHAEHDHKLLRVTLVRHPCDWLADCYTQREMFDNHQGLFSRFFINSLGTDNGFDRFVSLALFHIPGAIGELYSEYKADSVMRIEDQPWALIELLNTLGVPKQMRDLVKQVKRDNVTQPWDKGLRRRVIEAEKELVDAYDYY